MKVAHYTLSLEIDPSQPLAFLVKIPRGARYLSAFGLLQAPSAIAQVSAAAAKKRPEPKLVPLISFVGDIDEPLVPLNIILLPPGGYIEQEDGKPVPVEAGAFVNPLDGMPIAVFTAPATEEQIAKVEEADRLAAAAEEQLRSAKAGRSGRPIVIDVPTEPIASLVDAPKNEDGIAPLAD